MRHFYRRPPLHWHNNSISTSDSHIFSGRDRNALHSSSPGRQKWRSSGGGDGIYSGNHVFENLEPDTEYEVRVRAKNRFGWTEGDTAFRFRTSLHGERRTKVVEMGRKEANTILYKVDTFIGSKVSSKVVISFLVRGQNISRKS